MAAAGWYPDPAGTPGAYRYWDGRSWSAETTADPAGRPPTAPGGPPVRRRRALPLLIGALALVVLLVVGAVVLWPRLTDGTTGGPVPTSSVTGGDDSSPTSSPTPRPTGPSLLSPRPTTSPRPTSPRPTVSPGSPSAPGTAPCPEGQPTARQDHPVDGRVHGGGLSFAEQPGFTETPQGSGLSWAYDVGAQEKRVEPHWFSLLAVGALSTVDGFEQPEQAAELVMECTATSSYYQDFTGRDDLSSAAVTVHGHPGWLLRSRITIDSPDIAATGDVVEVLVVDLGSPESLAMFWGAAPIGDAALGDQLTSVRRSLRVD
ncbi:MAG: hypothetical protein JWP61_1998 [Friedmanniella sp.]|nr:hypothetical protein [Friedmanniella sp.]